ncbi:hypothetical protein GCM10025876_01820 [Demequina litorisediminis]|uniref:Uncharacterized protein n=1 Tax=Demequina litorisediminis TaxID=1849022 RepID=A0ABQ6IB53_9MICO|nr:hypothetical protein GCM10025876_01820 [Demequina litorisediminis]
MLHGHETGTIVRHEDGEYIEVHQPLDEQEVWLRVSHDDIAPLELEPEYNENGVRRPGYRWDRFKQALSRFYYEERISPVTKAEYDEAQHHHGHGNADADIHAADAKDADKRLTEEWDRVEDEAK